MCKYVNKIVVNSFFFFKKKTIIAINEQLKYLAYIACTRLRIYLNIACVMV